MPGTFPNVIVVGGGLAGIAAACDLADASLPVTLLEARPMLGGKTWSFRDTQTGMPVDNGQHVFLGCCAAYQRFLQRLGVAKATHLQTRLRVPIFAAGQQPATLEAARFPLPAPLHLLPSFLRLPMLSWREKLQAARTLAAIAQAGRSGRSAYDHLSFADWLRQRGESDNAIKYLWNLITLPTLNENCERASGGLALMVFQEGLLRRAGGARIGYASVGLSDLLCDAAERYLKTRGAAVRLSARVAALVMEDDRLMGVRLADGAVLPAEQVVLALPHYALASLAPVGCHSHPFFARAAQLGVSPIVGVNLWLDRVVLREPLAAVIGRSDTYWVFDKGALLGLDLQGGQYLSVSISGAHRYLDQSREQIIAEVRGDLEAALPALRAAEITHALVIKERQATFAATPGSLAQRLPAATPVPGLFLAGAWTDTGWPATMEGAVLSGHAAARAVLRASYSRNKTESRLPRQQQSSINRNTLALS
ncbi:MAG TPA: hydroxysqualene dehydroxylase HpnE [Ktedonobacterales bacterium]|nr:hydroxysqualene dehydroxylase HpnE [Ktedonobacterales bacterium]